MSSRDQSGASVWFDQSRLLEIKKNTNQKGAVEPYGELFDDLLYPKDDLKMRSVASTFDSARNAVNHSDCAGAVWPVQMEMSSIRRRCFVWETSALAPANAARAISAACERRLTKPWNALSTSPKALLIMLFLILCLKPDGALANCMSFREFAVDNCSTACPTLDRSRSDIPMAVCKERVADDGGGINYACVCLNFPATAIVPTMRYYPKVEGNVTRCAASWATNPVLYTFIAVVGCALSLYSAAHFLYIVALSGICCCEPSTCTRINVAALAWAVSALIWAVTPLLRIVTQGEVPSWFALGFDVIVVLMHTSTSIATVLFYISISRMVYPGKDKARWRRCIEVSFWVLAAGGPLTYIVLMFIPLISQNPIVVGISITIFGMVGFVWLVLLTLYSNVFMFFAHKTMRQVRFLLAL